MSMGGGGGGQQSPMERMQMAMLAGVTDPAALEAISRGMTPMSYENYRQGKTIVGSAFPDVQKYGKQMLDLADGGLMSMGLARLKDVKVKTTPGMTERIAGRYGAAMPTNPQVLSTSLSDASTQVGGSNTARYGLENAQSKLRLQGLQL